jgi:hypothetical protein
VSEPAWDPTAPPYPDDGELDEVDGWIPQPRTNRLTVLLVAGLVAVAGFAGGVFAQRQRTPASASAASALGAGAVTGQRGGLPAGGFGAGQAPAAAAGPGAGPAAPTSGSPPVVVGTVVDATATTLRVRNFAGTVVVVHVPAGTPVTTAGLGGLRAGAAVAVTGTKSADGSVVASSVVNRTTG